MVPRCQVVSGCGPDYWTGQNCQDENSYVGLWRFQLCSSEKSAYASFYNSDGVEEEQCKKFWSESGEPLFTHSTRHFQGTRDDIFYTGDVLKFWGVGAVR